MKEIKFEDIRVGDQVAIHQIYEQSGISYDRKFHGTAAYVEHGVWRTAEGGHLVSQAFWCERTITLIYRPPAPLPTTPGTVFRATEIRGVECDVTVFVRSSIPFGRVYVSDDYVAKEWEHNAAHITAWEPL